MFCLVSERVCDIHSSYHVKKNTSSSTSSSSKTLCLQRERERANTKRDRQTEEEADVVSFLVPLERRRPFEIIIIVSELSERATSSFYLIPLRGPITLVFVICVQGIIEKKRKREREKTTTTKKTLDARKTRKRIGTSGPQMSNQAVILLRNQLRGERNGGVCPKSCFFVRDDDDVHRTQRRGGGGKSSSLFFSLTASFANWWCFFFPFREETPR